MKDSYFDDRKPPSGTWSTRDYGDEVYAASVDQEFYEAPDRFITPTEIKELAELLSASDDPDYDLTMALSELGIDPFLFSDEDLDAIYEAVGAERGSQADEV